jgi:NADPH:quinone reductase-like Zn-dependent oxidoreductase
VRAIRIETFGEPEVMRLQEVPDPKLTRGDDILIRVRACSLNHLDLWIRKGTRPARLPLILGSDCAGEIAEAGPDAHLNKGQRVAVLPQISCMRCERCITGYSNLCANMQVPGWERDGAYAEYIVLPASCAFPIPDGLGFEPAAAMPITFSTAWHMLTKRAQVKAGESVLVWAGTSGVGTAAIQIAKLLGARVFATAGNAKKAGLARALGAEGVVDHYKEDVATEVKKLNDGKPFDVVADCVGAKALGPSLAALRDGGRYVICGTVSGGETQLNLFQLYVREISLLGNRQGSKDDFGQVLALAGRGLLKPVIHKTYPLADVAQAHHALEEGGVLGKVVLTV